MDSQQDYYRSATQLINRHGSRAGEHAYRKMRHFLEKDDPQGAGAWLAIGNAIEELQNLTLAGTIH